MPEEIATETTVVEGVTPEASGEVTEGVENTGITPEATVEGAAAATPETPAINYETKYNEANTKIGETERAFQYFQQLAQQGNVNEIMRLFGGTMPETTPAQTEAPIDHAQEFVSSLELGEGAGQNFNAAVQAVMAPVMKAKDEEITQYKNALDYLLKEEGNNKINSLRKEIPQFQSYEPKIESIMRKNPALSAKEAFVLASHADTETQLKEKAVADYKASILNKETTSNVFQPGQTGKTLQQPPKFKNFADAYNYTKGKMAN